MLYLGNRHPDVKLFLSLEPPVYSACSPKLFMSDSGLLVRNLYVMSSLLLAILLVLLYSQGPHLLGTLGFAPARSAWRSRSSPPSTPRSRPSRVRAPDLAAPVVRLPPARLASVVLDE